MTRRIDIANVFNLAGSSMLTIEELSARIEELEAENAELNRRVASLALRLRVIGETPDEDAPDSQRRGDC